MELVARQKIQWPVISYQELYLLGIKSTDGGCD